MSDARQPSLGCGSYEVYFLARGGGTIFCRALNVTSISYDRRLNDVSECRITAITNGVQGNCCACYSEIRPWKHELAIFRDGLLVWVGPVTDITHRQGGLSVEFVARDLFTWFDKRVIELANTDYEVEDVDIKEVFDFLVTLAYNKEPWNMSWSFTNTGIPITKFYPGYFSPDRWGGQYQVIGNELRDLTPSGIDWTVVKRQMIGGNLETSDPSDKLIVTDQVFATIPDINIAGTGMGTKVAVAGGQGGYYGWADDQLWIEGSGSSEYGLLEVFYNENILDEEDTTIQPNAVTQSARARYELKQAPFISISNASLAADAPFTFDTLIPGKRIEVRIGQTCLSVAAEYRLYDVKVSVSANEGEKVDLQISPLGVDDILE